MTSCGSKLGVRVNGKMEWFTDATEALAIERAQLRALNANAPKLPYTVMLKASKKGVRS